MCQIQHPNRRKAATAPWLHIELSMRLSIYMYFQQQHKHMHIYNTHEHTYLCQPHKTALRKHPVLKQIQKTPTASSCSPLWLIRKCKIYTYMQYGSHSLQHLNLGTGLALNPSCWHLDR